MRVLAVNAGSSSVKLRVLDGRDAVVARHDLPLDGGRLDEAAVGSVVRGLPPVDAVGHRIVHGGTVFTEAARVEPGVEERLRALADLAPLHQAVGLAALEAVTRLLPGVPAVVCFDTAFHSSLPPEAATYPVPEAWRRSYGVRRYGFHGLSHAYAGRRVADLMGAGGADTGSLRVVTCHLGAGASLAAVRGGTSLDTTMGFTPLEGLVMATRSGSVDPGLVLWLQRHAGLTAAEVEDALERRSGLAAFGGSGDMREVLQAVRRGDAAAELALGVYLHRLRREVASMAAAMDGLDALAFTGGVGENAPAVRAGAARGLGFLGVAVDAASNLAAVGRDAEITGSGGRVRTFVLVARVDLEMARQVRLAVGGEGARAGVRTPPAGAG